MIDVREIYKDINSYMNKEVKIQGWIRNHRKQKEFGFIAFNDGTFFNTIQLVYDDKLPDFDEIQKIRIGSSIEVIGMLVESPKEGQEFEIVVKELKLLGDCPEDYPMQPKQHSREFLREMAYLRPRTNLFSAAFRVRSLASMAIHEYFQNLGYVYTHAPLITGNDGEGAGEMFQVTTLDLEKIRGSKEDIDYKKDFFGKKVGLTVTGQLEGEAFAMAFKKIYTFGPTFRAENSNTQKHASEFWMIEPEIAFADLNQNMDVMEDMLKYVVNYILEKASEEMKFFDKFVENGLIEKLTKLVNSSFAKVKHEDAITILREADVKWEFEPKYGEDIAREHEKYLTDVHFKGPVFVTDWPKEIKAFYMKLNEDGKTVAAVDLEVPGAGELMGGSQREENSEKLLKRMHELGLEEEGLEWYLNLRKYGGCVHSGFGMGFERLLIYITGIENIRDVIPFPRTPGNCEF
jgi:asparaginyl-tRNA synthetase